MNEATKKLEIFHYASWEEMEEARRNEALARTPQQRFQDMMALIRLSFRMNPAHSEPARDGLIILPKRNDGHL